MKKHHILYFLILIYCTILNAQNNENIVIGKIETIQSEILNEERKIWVHIPEEHSQGLPIFSKKNYPVMYLLDGDGHFKQMVGMLNWLSQGGICPEMIIIGITNTNRNRDLSPTKGNTKLPYISKDMVAQSGGGSNFMQFIEKELIPYVDKNYPTEPYKMFVGHSLGGLMVMNTLIETPNLFDSYVSIDPSMHWNDSRLLKKIKKTTLGENYKNKALYLSIANTMPKGMDIVNVQKDTTQGTQHIRLILELDNYLKQNSQKFLSYKGKFYPKDSHGSVALISEHDALRNIFAFYNLDIDISEFMNPENNLLPKIETHYKKISKIFGVEKKPDEEYINGIGYSLMSSEQFKKAEKYFKLNITNYPESFNVYDSMGDLYLATNNKEKAIENFKKSIELNKDSFSKGKLEKLLNE